MKPKGHTLRKTHFLIPFVTSINCSDVADLPHQRLSVLYDELTLLKRRMKDFKEARTTDTIDLCSLFKLVQVWTWERFKELQTKPNRLLKGDEPRMARWDDLKQERESIVRQILDKSNSFEWRSFTLKKLCGYLFLPILMMSLSPLLDASRFVSLLELILWNITFQIGWLYSSC
ncbi:unnamed protein product [Microthlaspi erraticum]|uniref:Aminotransferase-like plant mobile domain-containing protein n=1 Tax=Microthlaspi erraticum TaxID=1685480 RepID=A0A6D2K945_9BRAS|nr:unnamed protein product [Microthlaspi erraticum]